MPILAVSPGSFLGYRFFSPISSVLDTESTRSPSPLHNQILNRYSYCLNNPLKYIDPTGHEEDYVGDYIEGQLRYSGGQWSIYSGGQWNPIRDDAGGDVDGSKAVDKLINAYQGSSATTWSGFLKEIGLNISAGDYYYKSIDMPIIYISDEYYLSAYQIFSDESSKSYMWGVPIGYGFSLREAPDPVAYPTRHDVAEALRTSASGIDALGFAVSHVPPEYLATAAGVVGATGWGGCHYCVGCNCDIESRTMLVKRPC